jgi:hypothetical protein
VKSQLSAWVTVPSCMSFCWFGEMNVSWARVSLARSWVKALLGVVHAVFFADALQVTAAIPRSLVEQFVSWV